MLELVGASATEAFFIPKEMYNLLSEKLSLLAITLGILGKALAAPMVYEVLPPESLTTPQRPPILQAMPKEEVLRRIANCESNGKHDINGEVVKNHNKNGTTDYGKFQINSIHIPEAKKLGLDIKDKEDNETFANVLFQKFGPKIWFGYNMETGKCSWEK